MQDTSSHKTVSDQMTTSTKTKEFPAPKNLKDMRSFLGLANQLAAFVPDLAHTSAGLRPLLKKGNAWVWEKEHEEEFNKIKKLLTSPTIAKPFDDAKDTILLTDASRLHGLEYLDLDLDLVYFIDLDGHR